jgi:hypothetical protein
MAAVLENSLAFSMSYPRRSKASGSPLCDELTFCYDILDQKCFQRAKINQPRINTVARQRAVYKVSRVWRLALDCERLTATASLWHPSGVKELT